MNTKKKFDLTTFFVILVSIGLILLGMYFLNQSFTKKTISKVITNSTSKTDSSTKSEISVSTSSLAESIESKNSSSEKSTQSSTTSISSSSQSSNSSSSKNNSPLSKTEAKIKVLESLGGGSYEVQIAESGLEKPIFWVKDKKLKINNSSILKKDSEYRVSGITETANGFNYDSVQE